MTIKGTMSHQLSAEELEEIAAGRPTKFTPEWPPKPSNRPIPRTFAKCSEEFKKVSWPPKEDEVVEAEAPNTTVQLQDSMQMNDEAWKPCGTYKLVPTIYAEQPAQLNEDVWPPPECLDTSEKVIHDASRHKRVIRDYTVHFSKNKSKEEGKSYKVPPGTLHVVSQRGVLSYDNVDIGRGTMAEPADPNASSAQQQNNRHPQPPRIESEEEEEEEEEEEDEDEL